MGRECVSASMAPNDLDEGAIARLQLRYAVNLKLQATGVATLARGVGRAISELPHADQGTEEGLWPEEACLVFILIGVRLV